jgi:hypothetical protein
MGPWEHVRLDPTVRDWAGPGATNTKPLSRSSTLSRRHGNASLSCLSQPELYS